MATEDESWRKQFASEGNGGGDRPHRPSFNRNGGGYQRERREFRSNDGYNREGGYRQREGGYQRDNRGSREGGYQGRPANREGGYQRREGGYQQRPYNREGGYQQREGGCQARPYNREGGYENRPGGYKKRTQGYNPHAKYSMKKQIEYKEKHYDPDEPVRLNRYLANAGVCSRREADTFIQAGVVKVNGVVVTELGTKVKRSDEVMFHDQTINMEKKVYLLLNKPKDYVTTSDDPQNRKTVMDLVKNACRERIYPVGRLDRTTTGVLLFTNDGDLATKLTHPQYLKKKIYHVYCDKNVTAADLRQIAEGIMLEDGEIHADAIDYADPVDKKQVGIEIHSGRNRIVRRIFEHLGYKVVKLDRVYFAGLTKKNVKRGDWRFLTQDEVNMLKMGAFE
jgi:23S rRNA pseudouridine2605 synthase